MYNSLNPHLPQRKAPAPRNAMDNINHTYKLTNNSSWDQIPMEQHHNHLHHISTINEHHNSLFPNCPRYLQPHQSPSSSLAGLLPSNSLLLCEELEDLDDQEPEEELGAMKEMIYKIAAMRPVDIDPASIPKPKRRNVRISDEPQSVAARHRRERISERIRILQRLVPGGTKMDTASMLDEAVRYVKFLKRQIRLLQSNNTTQLTAQPPLDVMRSSNNSPCLASADINWSFAEPNKLGHGHGSKPDSTAAALAVGSSTLGEALGFNHEVISDHIINS